MGTQLRMSDTHGGVLVAALVLLFIVLTAFGAFDGCAKYAQTCPAGTYQAGRNEYGPLCFQSGPPLPGVPVSPTPAKKRK